MPCMVPGIVEDSGLRCAFDRGMLCSPNILNMSQHAKGGMRGHG